MNAFSLTRLIIRIMAIVILIQIFTLLLFYDQSIGIFNFFFQIVMLSLFSICTLLFSRPLAILLAPGDDLAAEKNGQPSAEALQPLAFATAGIILAVTGLLRMPAAMFIVLSGSQTAYPSQGMQLYLWLRWSETFLLTMAGTVMFVRAHALSVWWHTFTSGRSEE